MKLVKFIWTWLRLVFKGDRCLRTVYVAELPDKPARNTVYVLGEGPHKWFVAIICPCGCGALLQMSLLADAHPRWRLIEHPEDNVISLEPSVWRQVGCKSHFFLRRGKILWCG